MINKIFSVLGKVFLVILVLAGIIGMGIYLGIRLAGRYTPATPTAVPTSGPTVIVVTASPSPVATNTPVPTNTPTPTPTPIPPITINGGHSSYRLYSIVAPANWKIKKEHDEIAGHDVLVLSRNDYELTIQQIPGVKTGCAYAGEQQDQTQSLVFKEPVVINGIDGRVYRRGLSEKNANTYQVCERPEGNPTYISPTVYGEIIYKTPKKTDEGVMKEMDAIISTIKSQ